MTPTDLLTGPFLSSRDLTDSSAEPGFAITLRDAEGGDCAARALARLGFGTADRKAAA